MQYSKICNIQNNNKFKVATTPDTATLEYYQSIYTHCKQRFNIPDGIEVVKKSVYQYIENCINNYLFGNYNISEVRNNLYNNLVHYSQLGTKDLNKLNFNIIEYCEEKYPVQFKYSFDFESETETSNKGKQKLKQYSKTTPNTPILPKTTAKHLQTPEQRTSSKLPLTITLFLTLLAQTETPNSPLNQFSRLKDYTSPRSPTRQQETLQTSTNLLDYLAENTSEHSETLANEENVSESIEEKVESKEESELTDNKEEDEMTAYIAKIPEFNGEDIETKQFTDKNTSITLQNCFHNIKQELSESVMTYIRKFNKLLRQIRQLETNDYYSNAQILNQFITGLKDKLIKKVCPHAPEDLNSAIQHAKRYKMVIEEANCTKLSKTILLTNNNSNSKDINHPKDEIKITSHHSLITSLRIAITVKFLVTEKEIAESYNETNKIEPAPQPIQQQYQQPPTQYYQVPAQRLITQNQFTSQNRYQVNNNRISSNNQLVPRNSTQPRPNHYYTQLTRIAENTNLLDIFPFEFEANELLFLFSNAATNKQKAITAMYTEAEVEEKTICLILDSGSTGSIITYQLIQQLKRNVDQPAQTVIVTANSMKKTPIREIDNFSFTLDGITIPVKVLTEKSKNYNSPIKDNMSEYPLLVKASVFEFEEKEEKPVQTYFATKLYPEEPETPEWNIPYSKPEPKK
ncbi:hypothetical protein G9A89_022713 [Geosiphon pyriformis]|nr:hypothetical protein G9A89_022713 [Geosiphon pyriformis]